MTCAIFISGFQSLSSCMRWFTLDLWLLKFVVNMKCYVFTFGFLGFVKYLLLIQVERVIKAFENKGILP